MYSAAFRGAKNRPPVQMLASGFVGGTGGVFLMIPGTPSRMLSVVENRPTRWTGSGRVAKGLPVMLSEICCHERRRS